MSSRHRKDIVTLFDVFCEVGADFGDGVPIILQKYPDDFDDAQTLKSILQFTFPCGLDCDVIESVQLFSFVLTNDKSEYTFAFCRYAPTNNTCLCILSGYSWSDVFYRILNHVSVVMNNHPASDLDLLLSSMYHSAVPQCGSTLSLQLLPPECKFDVVIPDSKRLPTFREDKFMLDFYNALSERQLLALYASVLKERRLIFSSSKLGQLSACVFAAASLLYPMQWQNIFIPVLPVSLVDMLMAPMPYLIGIPKRTLMTVKREALSGTLLIDLDQQTVDDPHNDISSLPTDVISFLRHELRSSPDMILSDGLARSFFRTNVFIFGSYRKGVQFSTEYKWNDDKFIQSQRGSMKVYIRSLTGCNGVQYFERFIDERLAALNAGQPIEDEFEKEARLLEKKCFKSSNLGNPEVLQNAVTSVRENMSDVIGVMKDKVYSIGDMKIKDRFGRLTPKELKKSAIRKSPVLNDKVMSFDTQQWTANSVTETSASLSSEIAPSNDGEATVEDLIDFNEPESDLANKKNALIPRIVNEVLSLDPLLESISSPTSGSKCDRKVDSRMSWERFDST